MSASEPAAVGIRSLEGFVCPRCKGPLAPTPEGGVCQACGDRVLADGEILDFFAEERAFARMDLLAPVYETRLWYPLALALFGGLRTASADDIRAWIARGLSGSRGPILDAACGPGTMSRHLASAGLSVIGVDGSLGMLRRGVAESRRHALARMRFAHANVESLPFAEETFDGAICSGALHLFPDPLAALCEIARSLRPRAPLVVMTFVEGDRGLFRFSRLTRGLARRHGIRPFVLRDLEAILESAGFEPSSRDVRGSLLLIRAIRRTEGAVDALSGAA